ncbi:hypothetical protein Pmani_000975 [Petrolisthes manimaculis]|uniref:Fibrinogen C-terminal domain-containing protein n=1 Tax=Petrolisthes manimaculis TaxID=1843537 RepID=A0AAE1UKR5_9EUCA|nr:hypothetical protein Pmani_000975 [Petrolisthes manimaculis]
MKALLFSLCILTTTTLIISDGSGMVSEAESRIIIKKELQSLAHNFQTTMTSEISNLESEMFMEFLRFSDEIGLAQISFSEAVQQNLSTSTTSFFSKFGKVMTYSVYMIQTLNDKLSEFLVSVNKKVWPHESSSLLSKIQDQILEVLASTNTEEDSGRSRRHLSSQLNGLQSRLLALQELTYDKIFEDSNPIDEPPTSPYIMLATNIDLLGAQMELGKETLGNQKAEQGTLENDKTVLVKGGEETLEKVNDGKEEMEEEKVGNEIERLPKDCLDLLLSGHTQDRVYTIYPTGSGVGVEVWCDQGSDGGGWTVLMTRGEGHPQLNFTRPATYYTHGFGHPYSQYWIGLEYMSAITREVNSTLRVQLTDSHQHLTPASAIYRTFSVGERTDGYMLKVGGYDMMRSNARDALTPHSDRPFSFLGGDHGKDCSNDLGVGWWFLAAPDCYTTLPTGRFNDTGRGSLVWGDGTPLTSINLAVKRNNI